MRLTPYPPAGQQLTTRTRPRPDKDSACRSQSACQHLTVKRKKTAIIIGAGPAGLTAAYELLTRTDVQPIVLEKSTLHGRHLAHGQLQGQPHRHRRPPLLLQVRPRDGLVAAALADGRPARPRATTITLPATDARRSRRMPDGPRPASADEVMLVRQRKSRIYFLRKFFDYPITLSVQTLRKLGRAAQPAHHASATLRSVLFPPKNGANAGTVLHQPLRARALPDVLQVLHRKSLGRALRPDQRRMGRAAHQGPVHRARRSRTSLKQRFQEDASDVAQKDTETSLIEQFLYPKFGPGQMWETVAQKVTQVGGGDRHRLRRPPDLHCADGRIVAVGGRGRAGRAAGDSRATTSSPPCR